MKERSGLQNGKRLSYVHSTSSSCSSKWQKSDHSTTAAYVGSMLRASERDMFCMQK
jgi:hypothetical protein